MNAYADVATLKSDAYCGITPTTEDAYLRNLLEQSSRLIDWWAGRFFYCRNETLYFDGSSDPLRIGDILSISAFATDDDDDATFENTYTEDTDYRLYPLNDFPKTEARIMSTGSYSGFASGVDKGIEITGVFGYGDGNSATPYSTSVDTLGDNLSDSATSFDVVDDGGNFGIGQTVLVDAEQIYITGISTDTLTIIRGVNGTTAVGHNAASGMYVYQYPQPIAQACLITAMRAWKRKDSAYQDVVSGGELGTVITSKGIDPDVAETIRQYRVYKI